MAARGGGAGGAGSGSGPSAGTAGEAAEPALRPGEVAALHPQEVAARLQRMRRELSNRRKILVKNLPQDSSSQEVHELLQDYELKYCYVDRNKRTAFVTLLNGEQAQSAIQRFHQFSFRGRELTVQLQPTDALLCITNLPISFTLEEFEELVRAYGNIERCFLVYSEVTGHSKGYGFVEYMKKDFAAKARLELLGRQMGASALFAQWMDVNLLASELIHSKCLCIDKLPSDYSDSEELLQLFSGIHKPVFCQDLLFNVLCGVSLHRMKEVTVVALQWLNIALRSMLKRFSRWQMASPSRGAKFNCPSAPQEHQGGAL